MVQGLVTINRCHKLVTWYIQTSHNKFVIVAFWCFDFRQLDVTNLKLWHKFDILWHNRTLKCHIFLVV
jgi:hypothetical protein